MFQRVARNAAFHVVMQSGNNCRDVVLRVFGRSESGQLWAHGRAKHCGFDVSRDYWVQFRSTASRRVGHDGHITKYKDTAHMR